jgi:adenine-specific DNA-methyltransferase
MATGLPKTKWSGANEVNDNASLSMSLSYDGKHSEKEILATKGAQLKLLYGQHVVSHNRLYYGDNLSILSTLLQDSTIHSKVRLVYIDPPFATGSIFQSRSQKDAYTDLMEGAEYIEFIRQRLILLRELLASNGSIYVHLDANMVFHVKVIMDEIFGVRNFRNCITRKKCNPKNYTRKTYGNITDYILFYTKSDEYVWHRPYNKWTREEVEREYQYVEEGSGRRYKKVPIHAPGVRNGATGGRWRGMLPPPGKHWQYVPDKLDEMDRKGEIYWSPNGNPRRKVYLDDSPGKPFQDIWLDFKDAHNQNIQITGYPTEKNSDLIGCIIQASSNENDIVLDCFAGSGTTLVKAEELNRKWIGIDNSPQAIATILKRFICGTQPMGDFVGKQNTDSVSQMSLFDNRELHSECEEDATVQPSENNKPITDFALFSSVRESDDLVDILRKWRSDVEVDGMEIR